MKTKKNSTGTLLYHPVHGVCRIDRMTEEIRSGKKVMTYSLIPKTMNKMKARFVVSDEDLKASGFHNVISTREAHHILDYLKAGDSSTAQTHQTWMLAQTLLILASEKFAATEQRKRQALEYSAKGLVGELAFVLKTTPKASAGMIQKSLGRISKNNPSVNTALEQAGED